MDDTLGEQLINAMFSFHKMAFVLSATSTMPINEYFVLKRIAKGSGCTGAASVSDIHQKSQVSLPAVSQLLKSLESKGFIERNIAADDRRKIMVSLTPAGQEVLKRAQTRSDTVLNEFVLRFGHDDTRQLTQLCQRSVTVLKDMQSEMRAQ